MFLELASLDSQIKNRIIKNNQQSLFLRTYLTHMGHIKESRFSVGTTPQMLLHDTSIVSLVQHGQFIASKGNHISSQFLVKIVQRRFGQILVGTSGSRKRTSLDCGRHSLEHGSCRSGSGCSKSRRHIIFVRGS